MRRREFIGLLGGAAVAWSHQARAQQTAGRMRRLGFLGSATAVGSSTTINELRAGLHELGYVEGQNIVIEYRWAEERYDRLPQLVRELIETQVDLLITHGTPGTRAAKQATSTVPIVMAISGDAVATGLVSSLARPEANVTGSTFFLPELNAKRLEVPQGSLSDHFASGSAFKSGQSCEQANHSGNAIGWNNIRPKPRSCTVTRAQRI